MSLRGTEDGRHSVAEMRGKESRRNAGEEERPGRRGGKGRNRKGAHEGRPHRQENGVAKLRYHKWINRQVTDAAYKGDLNKLLDTIHSHIPQMNSINLVTALHRVTKLVSSNGSSPSLTLTELLQILQFAQLWQTVAHQIQLHLSSAANQESEPFEVQCMSIVCWSCATLRLYATDLLSVISDIAMPRLWELKPFELSNMVWAYAKLQLGKTEFYNAVANRLLQRADGEFTQQCLSMMAWSFASAKQRNAVVFGSLAEEITRNALDVKPQEIANSLWAYAKVHCADRPLFFALADAACASDLIFSFKPQELSNTVWAFATVSFQHPTLFEKAAKAVVKKRHELLPQNTANILWAYAKLQSGRRSGLFRALLSDTAQNLATHKPQVQEISAIVWAAAREEYPLCKKLFETVAESCKYRLEEFPAQALANMVKSFAVGGGPPGFICTMTAESLRRLQTFDTLALLTIFRGVIVLHARHLKQQRSRGAWAEASSEWTASALSAMVGHVSARLPALQESEMMNLSNSIRLLLSAEDKPSPEVVELKAAFFELLRRHGSAWERWTGVAANGPGCVLGAEDEDDLLGGISLLPDSGRDSADGLAAAPYQVEQQKVQALVPQRLEPPRWHQGDECATDFKIFPESSPSTGRVLPESSRPMTEVPSWSVWSTPMDSAWLQDALNREPLKVSTVLTESTWDDWNHESIPSDRGHDCAKDALHWLNFEADASVGG